MSLKPSNNLIKDSLSSHSWMGLTVSALMYLVCLTGTIVVFFEEFERWEQPNIEEYNQLPNSSLDIAIAQFYQRVQSPAPQLYIVLPTEAVPRAHVSDGKNEFFINKDGSLSDAPIEGWTHFLKALHINLHLPQILGLIIVGVMGVLLCSLIISGLIAHPRIFKDAFKLRLGDNKNKEQADIHNRLGVWGTPFYFMIGLTGAFIGLVSIIIAAGAFVLYDNDRGKMIDAVYGGDPVVVSTTAPPNLTKALASLSQVAPNAKPIYFLIHDINTDKQFVEIAATLPNRLIYSEMYRFKNDGSYINHQGLSDASVGGQIAYSVYRIHFGHFGGFAVKIFYALMGLALVIICASGMNIWLAKRKHRSYLNDAWVSCVWGTPFALTISALASLFGLSSLISFLVTVLLSFGACVFLKNDYLSRLLLIYALATSLLLLVIKYSIDNFESAQPTIAIAVNASLITVAIMLFVTAYIRLKNH